MGGSTTAGAVTPRLTGRVLSCLETARGVAKEDLKELHQRLQRLHALGGEFCAVGISEEIMISA